MDEIRAEAGGPATQGGTLDDASRAKPHRLRYAGKHVHFYQAANG